MFHSIQIANSTWGLSPCAIGNDDDLNTKEVFDSMLHELKHPAGHSHYGSCFCPNSINNNAINCHYFKLILPISCLLCCPLGRKSNLLRGICSCYKLSTIPSLIEICWRSSSNINRHDPLFMVKGSSINYVVKILGIYDPHSPPPCGHFN